MQTPLTDQIANVSPVVIVLIVAALTVVRIFLARIHESWARTVSETCDTINFVLILSFLLVSPFVAKAFYIPSESMEQTLLVGDRLIVDKFSYRLHEPERHDVIVFNAPKEATDEGVDGIDFIKRLVGLPGDTVQVRAAQIVINGEALDPAPYENLHIYLRDRLNLDQKGDDSIKFFPGYLLINGRERLSPEHLAEKLGYSGAKIKIIPGQTIVNGKVEKEPFTREDPDYNYPPEGGALRLPEGELLVLGDNRNFSKDSHAWGTLKRERVVGRARLIFWPPARGGRIP